jgi:hypothetical protein
LIPVVLELSRPLLGIIFINIGKVETRVLKRSITLSKVRIRIRTYKYLMLMVTKTLKKQKIINVKHLNIVQGAQWLWDDC